MRNPGQQELWEQEYERFKRTDWHRLLSENNWQIARSDEPYFDYTRRVPKLRVGYVLASIRDGLLNVGLIGKEDPFNFEAVYVCEYDWDPDSGAWSHSINWQVRSGPTVSLAMSMVDDRIKDLTEQSLESKQNARNIILQQTCRLLKTIRRDLVAIENDLERVVALPEDIYRSNIKLARIADRMVKIGDNIESSGLRDFLGELP